MGRKHYLEFALTASCSFAIGFTLGHYGRFSGWAIATVWGMAAVYFAGFILRLR